MYSVNNTDDGLCNLLSGNSVYLIEINSQYSKTAFRTNNSGSLSPFGKVSEHIIDELKEYYSDMSVIKYAILPDKILLILCVKTESHKNELHLAQIIPFGVHTLVAQLKNTISKKTGISIWNKSFDIQMLKDRKEFLSACSLMNITSASVK